MKKLFVFIILFLTITLHAQDKEIIKYTEVIKTLDSTKPAKVLYAAAKIWFTQTFKNPKEVIILEDADNNILVGRGSMKYSSKVFMGSGAREGWISFDITIACKDGRYKYDFTNFIHEGNTVSLGIITNEEMLSTLTGMLAGGPKGYKIKVTNEIREIISNKVNSEIEDLKKTMNKPIISKEEW
ncbi:DUF4468 domain-containing protein [Chryseobacterium sp. ERMR1:04]|uniref:DUF4468 domain-containing protein n=1 Tax=Chryseobacterium sp. ERMR1:04 TaxID=1705393 RepID=UPI0006C86212|nr:DUF4468 domain-containing protein [Chryseobacterium sp. ERMR1:04]KPH13513.1 hypothetical protein AMQ68_08000 [Chryseobacterium sp. ERMR1:04]